MDDQIDGRTLVGSYVCTDRPGEFRWQPGSLTQVFFVLFGLPYLVINDQRDAVMSCQYIRYFNPSLL